MIHVFDKLLEIYIIYFTNIELLNCSVNEKRVYSQLCCSSRWNKSNAASMVSCLGYMIKDDKF